MKNAEQWFQDGLAALHTSQCADYHSDYVGDLEKAVTAFEEALSADKEHVNAYRALGFALAGLGRHSDAVKAYEATLARTPYDTDARLGLAQSLQRSGDFEQGLLAFEEVLRARPRDAEALFGRAEVLDSLRRDSDALSAWEAVLDLPDNRTLNLAGCTVEVLTTDFRTLQASLCQACCLARLGSDLEAEQAFSELLMAAWTALHGPCLESRFANALRELDAACAAYRKRVNSSQDHLQTYKIAARMWLAAGRLENALECGRAAVNAAPDDGDAWWALGEAQAKAGRLEEGVRSLRHALTLNPVARLGIAVRLKVMEAELARDMGLRWRVLGHDTFAREQYLVGEYDSAEEAEECVRAKEAAAAASQDESLRDSFWIEPPGS